MMKNFRDYVNKTTSAKEAAISNVTNQLLSPTGFMYFDYMNGMNITVYDEYERPVERFNNIGIMNGSVNTIISKSGVGKTTFVMAMAKGIIEAWIKDPILRSYINPEQNPKYSYDHTGLIQVIDAEKTFDISNAKRMTQYPNKLLKNHVEINQVSTDRELIKCIEKHVKFKVDTMKKIYLPMKDTYGDYLLSYPPTVCIIDSFNKINPEDTEGLDLKEYDKATNNTAGARRARIISSIYSSLVNYAKYYNIIFLCINHINVAPNMSFLPAPKQYHGLKQGETLSGGEKPIYLASNIIRLDKLKEIGGEKSSAVSFGEGIDGAITRATIIKSKTNKFGSNSQLVYLNSCGYDPLYSTIYEAMNNGDLMKSGNSYVLEAFPDIKFNIRNFRDKFSDDLRMLYAFYDEISRKAERFLSNGDELEKANRKETKAILNSYDGEYSGVDVNTVNEIETIYQEIYNTVVLNRRPKKMNLFVR